MKCVLQSTGERCQREPFFGGLLGARYGWIPLAERMATSHAQHVVGTAGRWRRSA